MSDFRLPRKASAARFSIGERFAFLKWASDHLGEARALVGVVEQWQNADTPTEYWAAVKTGGDILVPMYETSPLYNRASAMPLPEEFACLVDETPDEDFMAAASIVAGRERLFKGDGTFLKILVENLPAIMTFIKSLSELFPKA